MRANIDIWIQDLQLLRTIWEKVYRVNSHSVNLKFRSKFDTLIHQPSYLGPRAKYKVTSTNNSNKEVHVWALEFRRYHKGGKDQPFLSLLLGPPRESCSPSTSARRFSAICQFRYLSNPCFSTADSTYIMISSQSNIRSGGVHWRMALLSDCEAL